VIATTVDEKYGGFAGQGGSLNMVCEDCIVEGPTSIAAEYVTDTGPWVGAPEGMEFTSGCGYNSVQTVRNCEVRYTTQGIFGGGSVCENNLIEWCCNSFNPDTHENGFVIFESAVVSRNIIRNLGEGVTGYINPGWGGMAGSQYFYNNVVYNVGLVGAINPINVTNGSAVEGSPINAYVYNNVLEHSAGFNLGTTKAGAAFDDLRLRNNLVINDSGLVYTEVDSEANDYPVNTIDYNVNMTLAEAEAAGMLEANAFEPSTSVTGVTSQGVDLSGVFTTDINGATRVVPWDIGAYEYNGVYDIPDTPTSLTLTAI